LYLASLMARTSFAIPSALPMTRVLVPLVGEHRDYLNGVTARVLYPLNYPVFDSFRGKDLPVSELINSQHQELEPSLLAGLAHYESAFNPKASSRADAHGLLQLLLSTANEQYQKQTGDKTASISRERLNDPDFNLKIGVGVLSDLLTDFNGSVPLALASYNAGEKTVRDWLSQNQKLKDPQVQIDLLLMNENSEIHVSDYVSTVLGKADWYRQLYN
jgi:soluble lytic murein transglycosylase-like protein